MCLNVRWLFTLSDNVKSFKRSFYPLYYRILLTWRGFTSFYISKSMSSIGLLISLISRLLTCV